MSVPFNLGLDFLRGAKLTVDLRSGQVLLD
jgi:hypothetical protein